MCGIFFFSHRGAIDKKAIYDYFNCIKHRGPDHTSYVILSKFGYTVFLGFHRLAIIDPSPKTNSILVDEEVYLACNGEIYNYRYLIDKYKLPIKTGSDCEVILQLYKHHPQRWPRILQELDGVFAFVLYDQNIGSLFISRDRIGVRPLFEAMNDTTITFASEAKAVPLCNVTPYPPGVYKHINLLDTLSIVEECKWYDYSSFSNVSYVTAQEIIKTLFTDAVKKRLVADRPIGFLVSGGLDSSLVAAVAQRLIGKKITTFSIGLSGSPDLVAAAKVATFLGSNHHEIIISTDDIIKALPKVVYHAETFDITTIRASIPMYLISKYISENTDCKVIFSGEGADELFGGYLYFHKAPSFQEFQSETECLINELYKYDVLRADRTTAAWGLELRVPFLDVDLLNFVTSIDPVHKMAHTHKIEKAILRDAFHGYLPNEILYRQKEAFSDGVGHKSVEALKEHAAGVCADWENLPNHALVTTDEARLYYFIFREYYCECTGLYTEYYWMPRWQKDVTDPSATCLEEHLSRIDTEKSDTKNLDKE